MDTKKKEKICLFFYITRQRKTKNKKERDEEKQRESGWVGVMHAGQEARGKISDRLYGDSQLCLSHTLEPFDSLPDKTKARFKFKLRKKKSKERLNSQSCDTWYSNLNVAHVQIKPSLGC